MEAVINSESAHALLESVYQNPEIPLAVRMRAAMAALRPKLAVTAQVSESDFAALLDRRLKRIEEMKLIEAKPTNGAPVGIKQPLPRAVDRTFRRI